MAVTIRVPRLFKTRHIPTAADILVNQANTTRDAGDPATAAILYKRAIEMGAHSVGIRKQLANMLKDSGRFDEAFDSYARCLQAEPQDGDTLLQLGHLFKMQGNIPQASNYYARAANGSPPSPHAMAELAALNTAPSSQELLQELTARMDRNIATLTARIEACERKLAL